MKILTFLILLLAYTYSQKINYGGHKVYRFLPTEEGHLGFLQNLELRPGFEVWNDITGLNEFVDVMVGPENQYELEELAELNGIEAAVWIEDVQELISEDFVQRDAKADFSWDKYYELEGINNWLETMSDKYPGRVEIISAGRSYEGRDIKGVKISIVNGNTAVFIEAGIHAREWISPATITYFINELLTSNDTRIRKIAESFDFYIFPVTNPDGFTYTHTTDRMWRKTRKPYPNALNCSGVDPNRNWDYEWGVHSTSTNVCSLTYGGPNAFSEPETSSLAAYIDSIAPNLDAYFSFHSYSQVLLIPFANSTENYANFDDLFIIGSKAIEALKGVHNTTYRTGNNAVIMGKITGTTTDWVKDTYGTPITFTYELRDTGRYGFLLPPEQIIPNSEEVTESLIVIFEEAAKLGYFPREARNKILH